MDGWINWMDEQMNEWMNEWMTEWMNDWMNEWMNEWLNEWMNEWINKWKTQVLITEEVKLQLTKRSFKKYTWWVNKLVSMATPSSSSSSSS